MPVKEFFITEDGIRLHAKLEMPQNAEKCPLLIIIHGFTGHMEERHIVAAAQTAVNAGYAALRAEMYGHGKSDGSFENHTLLKWLTNAMTVIDYAKTLDFVTALYLLGHSQGGLLTILAGGMRPDDLKAIIPLSPALVIPDGARKGELLGGVFDPRHIPDKVYFGQHTLSGNYIRAAQLLHAEDSIQRYHKPVLLIHGDEDESVPVQYSIDAAAQYENAKLVIIPGDDHCFDYHLDLMTEALGNFLKRQLQNA